MVPRLVLLMISTVPFFAPLLAWAGGRTGQSLCGADERVYFECSTKVKAGKKQIALCGSQILTGKDAFLQYRFGKKGSVELQFPPTRSNPRLFFRQSHYFRYQVNLNAVGFTNNGATYWVLDEYVGDITPPEKRQGVSYSKNASEDAIKTLLCEENAVNELGALTDILPCAKGELYSIGDCE